VKIHLQSILNKYCKYINNNYNINMNTTPLWEILPEDVHVIVPFSYERRDDDLPWDEVSLTGGTYALWDWENVLLSAKERTPQGVNMPDGRRLLVHDLQGWSAMLITWILDLNGLMRYKKRVVPGTLDISDDNACASVETMPGTILTEKEVTEVQRIFAILIPATLQRIDEILAERQAA
jgi:hypothetical protein